MKMKLKDGSEEDRWVAYCSDLEGLIKYIRKERRIGENGESLYDYRFMAIALWLSLYGHHITFTVQYFQNPSILKLLWMAVEIILKYV